MEDKAELYREHMTWIESLEISGDLTEWEEDFVSSVKKYLQDKGSLTPRQREVLENIYAKKGK
jgi:hypothetical protein